MSDLIQKLIGLDVPLQAIYFPFVIVLLWLAMIVAVAVDMWSGPDSARARGEKIISGGLRRTFSKIGDYWRVQLLGCVVDLICSLLSWYGLPYCSILVTLAVIAIEARSVWENGKAKKSNIAKLPLALRDIMRIADAKSPQELVSKITAIIPTIKDTADEKN